MECRSDCGKEIRHPAGRLTASQNRLDCHLRSRFNSWCPCRDQSTRMMLLPERSGLGNILISWRNCRFGGPATKSPDLFSHSTYSPACAVLFLRDGFRLSVRSIFAVWRFKHDGPPLHLNLQPGRFIKCQVCARSKMSGIPPAAHLAAPRRGHVCLLPPGVRRR
jgi:hypothetical protein